jgi:hypothetical protein
MAKTKFRIEYVAELDTGDLSPHALAEYLGALEENSVLNWSLWEVFGNSMTMNLVEVVEEKTKA